MRYLHGYRHDSEINTVILLLRAQHHQQLFMYLAMSVPKAKPQLLTMRLQGQFLQHIDSKNNQASLTCA